MMDYEKGNDEDIIYGALNQSVEKSNKILHKKALALVKGLKDQLGLKNTSGVEGIKNYVKNVLNLIDIIFNKLSSSGNYNDQLSIEDDLKNSEALIFTLAICVKQLPPSLLRNIQILEKIKESVEKMMKLANVKLGVKLEVKKYCLIIAEKLLVTRNESELQNDNDFILKFFTDLFFMDLEDSCINQNEELQKCLAKSLSKILKTPNMIQYMKLTFLLKIKNYLTVKIRIMDTKKRNEDYEEDEYNYLNDNKINQVSISQGEALLKFCCSILQFLPFELVNDLILELTELIVISENKYLLLNALLCFEVAFNTKTFALETSEKIIKLLLNKDFLMTTNEEDNHQGRKENLNIDIHSSLAVAFMKSLTQVLLNLGKVNILIGVKYLTSVVSILGEFMSTNDEFLKNSIFNSLQSLFSNILNKKNMTILFKSTLKTDNKIGMDTEIDNNFDPNELTLEINIVNKKSSNNSENLINILENISSNLLYLTSDRFDDLKPGFNLLYIFIEKITAIDDQNFNEIHQIIDGVLSKLNENEKLLKSQTFKVFIGKLFNIVHSSFIIRAFPLQILDFDICNDEYTDNSKVWIISYIEKFLKNENVQNVKEFYESFFPTIEDLEKVITKLKSIKKPIKEGVIIESEEERAHKDSQMIEDGDEIYEDEKFDVDRTESEHVRNIKIKRYELILQQTWSLLIKFSNWNENYNLFVTEILKKFNTAINTYNKDSFEIFLPSIREIIFKIVCKMINNSFKNGDIKSIEVIKKEGKIFFNKSLNLIIHQKVVGSEMRECFNLISTFCRIMSEKFLFKIICDMIDKFDKSIQNFHSLSDNLSNCSNKAKLNESLNLSANDDMNVDGGAKSNKNKNTNNNNNSSKKEKLTEFNLLALRIEIINYILKNMKSFEFNQVQETSSNPNSNLLSLLNTFFEKFFFNEKINTSNLNINYSKIRKKLMDLFMQLMSKMSHPDQIIEIFTKFANNYKGLELLSAKQKTKIFEFLIENLIKKIDTSENTVDISECISQMHILIEIVSLTKDMNRKVRNSAYEMIGKITDFMSDSNLFNDWIKMILAILASNSPFLKSASINAIARIFWQKRNSSYGADVNNLLNETSTVILLLIKDNNKELTKSIFLFIRVLLYLNKSTSTGMIQKIIKSIFIESNEDVRKEFKVKIRNLLKNLIIKFSFDEIKKVVPKEVENLLVYINKYVVKKIKNITRDEETLYGDLDNSVMLDNDENLLDEEEEYIQKEFNKIEKRKNDEEREKFFNRLEKLNIDEDDPELIKKHNESKVTNDKLDKIEQLFSKDNIELDNFFYVNPYAYLNNQSNKDKKEITTKEEEKDVFYDKKKGKIIIKDFSKKEKKNKSTQIQIQNDSNKEVVNNIANTINAKNNYLNKKRFQNVQKDKEDFDDHSDGEKNIKKRKISHSKEKVEKAKNNKKSNETHILKFSGEEYQNKVGKGDKLITGKYEPFAYIQLNPKSTSSKRRTESLRLFEKIMHPEKNK